jgi:hypothetical protein
MIVDVITTGMVLANGIARLRDERAQMAQGMADQAAMIGRLREAARVDTRQIEHPIRYLDKVIRAAEGYLKLVPSPGSETEYRARQLLTDRIETAKGCLTA